MFTMHACMWLCMALCFAESLVALVRALVASSGHIPRMQANSSSNSSLSWDCSELCLELLFTVLLRNRDRISVLWPRAFEYFQVSEREGLFTHSAAQCTWEDTCIYGRATPLPGSDFGCGDDACTSSSQRHGMVTAML